MGLKYYIWSFEHNKWWNSNYNGYTANIEEAGTYGLKEAIKICLNANNYGGVNEAMIPVETKQ